MIEATHLRPLPSPGARTPPHSPEAEGHLIAAVLLDADGSSWALAKRVGVKPASFYDGRHQIIWAMLDALHGRSLPCVDLAVLIEELRTGGELDSAGGIPYLLEVSQQTPTSAQARYFAEKVVELWTVRHAIVKATAFVEDCFGLAGWDEWMKASGELGTRLLTLAQRTQARTLAERTAGVRADAAARAAGTNDKSGWIYTGLPGFDRECQPLGSIEEDHLILVGGGSSQGKSALMRVIAGAALKASQRVVVFSRETSVGGWVRALASNWARVDLQSFDTAPKDVQARFATALDEIEAMADKLLFVFQHEPCTPLLTIEDLVTQLRAWVHAHGAPHLVVIDYLQRIGTKKRCGSREQEVAEVSGQIQALQRELGSVFLVGAQYNEAGLKEMRAPRRDEDGKIIHRLPGPGDLRETQAMYHDCDRALMIYRPPEDAAGRDQSGGDVLQPEQWICQIKRRNGRSGQVVRCLFEKKFLNFAEIGAPEKSWSPPAAGKTDHAGAGWAAVKAAIGMIDKRTFQQGGKGT